MIRFAFAVLTLSLLVATAVAEDAGTVSPTGERGANQPALTVDADGKLYLVYGAGDPTQIWLRTSEDGTKWSEPQLVSEGAYEAMSGNTRGGRIAVVDGTVVVTAFASFKKGAKKHLYCFHKRARDKKLSATRVSDNAARDMEGLHDMTVDGKGRVHVVWMDSRSGGAEPWCASSSNEGRSFSGARALYTSPDGSICPCCAPSIAAAEDGKTLVVQFRNRLKNAAGNAEYDDMYAASSNNGGRKWTIKRLDDCERWKG